jgi:hypothetical protein
MARRGGWTRDPWTVAVAALASYRLTRLATTDDFPPAVRARDALAKRTPAGYDMLWSCPWCLGAWIAAGVTAAAELAGRRKRRDLFLLAAMPWAISAVTGLLADREVS